MTTSYNGFHYSYNLNKIKLVFYMLIKIHQKTFLRFYNCFFCLFVCSKFVLFFRRIISLDQHYTRLCISVNIRRKLPPLSASFSFLSKAEFVETLAAWINAVLLIANRYEWMVSSIGDWSFCRLGGYYFCLQNLTDKAVFILNHRPEDMIDRLQQIGI